MPCPWDLFRQLGYPPVGHSQSKSCLFYFFVWGLGDFLNFSRGWRALEAVAERAVHWTSRFCSFLLGSGLHLVLDWLAANATGLGCALCLSLRPHSAEQWAAGEGRDGRAFHQSGMWSAERLAVLISFICPCVGRLCFCPQIICFTFGFVALREESFSWQLLNAKLMLNKGPKKSNGGVARGRGLGEGKVWDRN